VVEKAVCLAVSYMTIALSLWVSGRSNSDLNVLEGFKKKFFLESLIYRGESFSFKNEIVWVSEWRTQSFND